MYSESLIGKDILGSLWSMSLIGCLLSEERIAVPFDRQFRAFAEAKEGAYQSSLRVLARMTGIKSEMWLAWSEIAPWRVIEGTSTYYDDEVLKLEISAASGRRHLLQFTFQDRISTRCILRGIGVRQMAALFGLVLGARFAFYPNNHDVAELAACIRELFEYVQLYLRAKDVELVTLDEVWRFWQTDRLPDILGNEKTDPAYRMWLKEIVTSPSVIRGCSLMGRSPNPSL